VVGRFRSVSCGRPDKRAGRAEGGFRLCKSLWCVVSSFCRGRGARALDDLKDRRYRWADVPARFDLSSRERSLISGLSSAGSDRCNFGRQSTKYTDVTPLGTCPRGLHDG